MGGKESAQRPTSRPESMKSPTTAVEIVEITAMPMQSEVPSVKEREIEVPPPPKASDPVPDWAGEGMKKKKRKKEMRGEECEERGKNAQIRKQKTEETGIAPISGNSPMLSSTAQPFPVLEDSIELISEAPAKRNLHEDMDSMCGRRAQSTVFIPQSTACVHVDPELLEEVTLINEKPTKGKQDDFPSPRKIDLTVEGGTGGTEEWGEIRKEGMRKDSVEEEMLQNWRSMETDQPREQARKLGMIDTTLVQ